MSGLTPEEVEVVWRTREKPWELWPPVFNPEAFQRVNKERLAEGRPMVQLHEAAAPIPGVLTAVEALGSVHRWMILMECKTLDDFMQYDPEGWRTMEARWVANAAARKAESARWASIRRTSANEVFDVQSVSLPKVEFVCQRKRGVSGRQRVRVASGV